VGESALEPIQLAVRSVIERAVLEMITRVYRAPGASCAIPLGNAQDPLRDGYEAPFYPQQTAYAAPYAPQPYAPQPYPQAAYAQPAYAPYGNRAAPYGGYYSADAQPGLLGLRGGL
jgi:curli production assembly/transport component CsgG/holdfast attachment protein HfaB